MSLNQVNSSGELERVAGLVNSEKINEMYEAFPSDASASNQLVTSNDTNSTTLTSTDTLASWVGNAKGVMTAFIGTSSKPSDIGTPLSSWGETMIFCIGDGVRKTLFAIDFSVAQHVIYTREYYNGSFTTNWTAIKDGNLTSSVTSGSTAPITSGGVYDAFGKGFFRAHAGNGTVDLTLGSGVYLLEVDEHLNTTPIAVYMVSIFANNGFNIVELGKNYSDNHISITRITDGIRATTTNGAHIWVNAMYFGDYS